MDAPVNFDPLRAATFDDLTLIQEILKLFISDLPNRIEFLRQEIEAGHPERIQVILSDLRESCECVGAELLCELLKSIHDAIENDDTKKAQIQLHYVSSEFNHVRDFIHRNLLLKGDFAETI